MEMENHVYTDGNLCWLAGARSWILHELMFPPWSSPPISPSHSSSQYQKQTLGKVYNSMMVVLVELVQVWKKYMTHSLLDRWHVNFSMQKCIFLFISIFYFPFHQTRNDIISFLSCVTLLWWLIGVMSFAVFPIRNAWWCRVLVSSPRFNSQTFFLWWWKNRDENFRGIFDLCTTNIKSLFTFNSPRAGKQSWEL